MLKEGVMLKIKNLYRVTYFDPNDEGFGEVTLLMKGYDKEHIEILWEDEQDEFNEGWKIKKIELFSEPITQPIEPKC
jgi:hypothetical protein